MTATIDAPKTQKTFGEAEAASGASAEKRFCARCGELEERCLCGRRADAFEQVKGHARRAARAIEVPAGERNPTAAALLSLIIPGLGQLYNGEPLKAILFFVGWFLLVPWALAVLDAYYSARVSNLEAKLATLTTEI